MNTWSLQALRVWGVRAWERTGLAKAFTSLGQAGSEGGSKLIYRV